jgi:hypothetical protein
MPDNPINNPVKGFDQFLTPEAMLTPGAAGAMTMMITNALALNFDTHRALTGLVLSFMFGAVVFVASRNIWQKGLFYVLNSLIIFCVALGTNAIGVTRSGSVSLSSAAFARASVDTSNDARAQALREALAQQKRIDELKQSGGSASDSEIRKLQIQQDNTLRSIIQSDGKRPDSFFQPWIK